MHLPFVCLLGVLSAGLAADELKEPASGIYAYSEAGVGRRMARNDGVGEIALGRRMGAEWGTASTIATSNENDRFRLDLRDAGPLPEGAEKQPLALLIAGLPLVVYGYSNRGADGTIYYLAATVVGRETATKVAAELGTVPHFRAHPSHRLYTTFRTEKSSYRAGEAVTLSMTIKNVGETPFTFMDGGMQRGPRNNQFEFVARSGGGAGTALADIGNPMNRGGGLANAQTLGPGDEFTKSVKLTDWFQFDQLDTIRITGLFRITFHEPGDHHRELWDDFGVGECLVRVVGGNDDTDDTEPADERKPGAKASEAAAPTVNRVVDLALGRPIAGAKIGLYRDRLDRSNPIGEMTTNELGAFEYPPETPEKENFYVEISAPGYLTDEWLGNWTVYRRHKGVRRADTFVLHRPVTLAGRVLGPDGKPLADVPLSFDYFNPKVASINARKFSSDAEGRFRLEDLPPGELFVRLRRGDSPARDEGQGGANFAIAHAHAAGGETPDDLVVDLSKSTCVLEGRLVDPAGQGVAGAWVAAAFELSSRRLDHTVHAQTSDDGSFRITGMPPGRFVMQLAHRRMDPVELQTGRPTRVELHNYLPGSPPPADRKAEPAWGDKAGELQVAAVVEPRKDQYDFGDKLLVKVLLRNSSNKPVTATLNSLGGAAVEIIDEEGEVRTFDYSRFLGEIASDTYHLQPGHEVTFSGAFSLVLTDDREESNDAENADGFVVGCRPGATYRLVCRVTTPDGSLPGGAPGVAEPGKAGLTTAPVTLLVAPEDN